MAKMAVINREKKRREMVKKFCRQSASSCLQSSMTPA